MKYCFILALSLLASSLAHPHHKHRTEKEEEEGPKKAHNFVSTRLSHVMSLDWHGEGMGMLVYQQESYMAQTPMVLAKTFTNTPTHVTAAGAMRFPAIELSPATLLSLHFWSRRNLTFTAATLRFQLEAKENEMSEIKNIHVDVPLCTEKGLELHCAQQDRKDEDSWLVLDGVPVPVFDFEFGSSGVGTLHLTLEDDEGNTLFAGRFFVKLE